MTKEKNLSSQHKSEKRAAVRFANGVTKKLVMTIVAALCSCSLLAVGVVAALTNFVVSIDNNFVVEINNVEGTLSVDRTGGVYGIPVENFDYGFVHTEGAVADSFSNIIYTTADGLTSSYQVLKNTKVNVDNENNVIEYVYKYVLDENNVVNTRISLDFSPILDESIETVYEYVYSDEENVDFDNINGVETFNNGYSIICDSAHKQVFVRTKFLLNTKNSTDSKIQNINTIWRYKLNFSATFDAMIDLEEDNFYRIEMGEFPQAVVDNKSLITSLNNYALDHATEYTYNDDQNVAQIKLNYYVSKHKITCAYNIGDKVYFGCTYNGDKYVYLPYATVFGNNTFSNDKFAIQNDYYWFKVEPIKWIILNENITEEDYQKILNKTFTNDLKLLSQNVLFSGIEFGQSNEWDCSYLRKNLNGSIANFDIDNLNFENKNCMLNQSFSDTEKNYITIQNTQTESRIFDKISVLSRNEVVDDKIAGILKAKVSDFAVANNLMVSSLQDGKTAAWWTRTETPSSSTDYIITSSGTISSREYSCDNVGIRPTMTINYNKANITYKLNDSTENQILVNNIYAGNKLEMPETPINTVNSNLKFAGWYTEPACLNKFDFDNIVTSNVTLYAKWVDTNDLKTVTFYFNDGTANIVGQTNAYTGCIAEKCATPQREGYNFEGWYKNNGDNLEIYDFNSAVSENLNLYAKWTKKPVIHFYYNNGTIENHAISIDFGSCGQSYNLPSNIMPNNDFAGWYQSLDGGATISDDQYMFNTSLENDISLYAQWNIKVQFMNNFSDNDESVAQTIYLKNGDLIAEQPAPISQTYHFAGWFEDANCTIPYNFLNKVNQNTKIYAKWTDKPIYSVTFIDSYDNTVLAVVNDVEEGSKVLYPLENPERSGKNFAGWYETEDGYPNESRINLNEFTIDQNITLYANWTSFYYNISIYNDFVLGNLNTNLLEVVKVNSDSVVGSLDVPVKAGYVFVGWCNRDGVILDLNTFVPSSNCSIFGKWSVKRQFTITINDDYSLLNASNSRTLVVYEGDTVVLGTPTYENGDVFKDYINESGTEIYNATGFIVDGDLTIYERRSVIITFGRNYSNSDISEKTYNIVKGSQFIYELPVYVRNGYTFAGWYTAKVGGELVENITNQNILASMTLYARWIED